MDDFKVDNFLSNETAFNDFKTIIIFTQARAEENREPSNNYKTLNADLWGSHLEKNSAIQRYKDKTKLTLDDLFNEYTGSEENKKYVAQTLDPFLAECERLIKGKHYTQVENILSNFLKQCTDIICESKSLSEDDKKCLLHAIGSNPGRKRRVIFNALMCPIAIATTVGLVELIVQRDESNKILVMFLIVLNSVFLTLLFGNLTHICTSYDGVTSNESNFIEWGHNLAKKINSLKNDNDIELRLIEEGTSLSGRAYMRPL